MSDEVLSEQQFDAAADRSLRALDRQINEIPEGVEADLESGILTLEFEDGGKFVVNSHRAARQIWMAAERTAWHFDYAPATDRWISAKTGEELWSTLEAIVSRKLGRPVRLAR
jgi:CyaY protein